MNKILENKSYVFFIVYKNNIFIHTNKMNLINIIGLVRISSSLR